MKNRLREWLWRWRIRRELKRSKGDLGQFYSLIGHAIARGDLPKELIEEPSSVLDWNCGGSFCSTEN